MSRLEQLRPKLKTPFTATRTASGLVLDCARARGGPLALPASAEAVLPLLDGNRSVQQIVDELHRQQGHVAFRALFAMLQKLMAAEFLEPGPAVEGFTPEGRGPLDRKPLFFLRPLFRRTLKARLGAGSPPGAPLFIAFAGLVIASAIFFAVFSGGDFVSNTFLRVNGSAWRGILYILVATSALLSLRHLVSALLLWLATGRVDQLALVLSPISLSLRIGDVSIYRASARWLAVLFHLAEIAAPLAIAGAVGGDLMTVAWFLVFQELSPHAGDAFTRLFARFCPEREVAQLGPFLRNRALFSRDGERWPLLYACYAILWAGAYLCFSAFVAARNFPGLWLAVTGPDVMDALASALLLAVFSAFLAYLAGDLLATVTRNLLFPLTDALATIAREISGRAERKFSDEAILKALKSAALFQGVGSATLDRLVKSCTVRTYHAGVALLIQGKSNDKLYVLIDGSAYVARRSPSGVRSRLAELEPGAVVGEVSALEGGPCTADVVTGPRCRVLEIPRTVVRAASKDKDASPDLERISAKVLLGQCIASSPLFKEIPAEIATFLSTRGALVEAPSGTTVTRQGDQDRTLYLIVRGRAHVHKDGQKVGELGQGDFFGEIALIAGVPRTASVVTAEETLLLTLRADDVWSVLSRNPALSVFLESVADSRRERKTAA